MLTKKTIMDHTKDKCFYVRVYNQECTLYGFQQRTLTNKQYYERFNTKVDVGEDISVTGQQCVRMEDISK